MSTRTKSARALAVLIAGSLTAVAGAQTPLGTTFTYQGQLKSGGSPANGSFNMEFRLFDVAAGGAPLATQTLPGVGVANGLFTVQLDFGAAYNGNKRWLEITVDGTPLSPRQELTAAPNALFASNADQLDGLNSTAFLTGVPNPLTLSGSNASHIIRGENASSSAGSTGVSGISTAAGGQSYGGDFRSSSPVGFGVYGVGGVGVFGESINTSGGGYGGYFQSPSTSGTGVFGKATALTGLTHGGWFETHSTDGRGLMGIAHASTGDNVGVFGQSNSSAGRGVNGLATAATGTNFGVIGESHSTDGRGVMGIAHTSTGLNYGVIGQSNSTSGRGVYGYASAGTGTTFGGSFEASSSGPDATGVFGLASSLSGINYGVWGKSNSTTGIGVLGINDRTSGINYGVYGRSSSDTGRGVYGLADSLSGTHYGVYGHNLVVGGFGVYANGNLGSFGTKSFRIDHPDDPSNKYLLHYAAESPEVINFYSGKVTLDAAGEAVVELPQYFAKINRDPRYTLTAVGAPMPMLHVADEIDEAALIVSAKAEPAEAAPRCTFRIAGGAPGTKVSWRVEALRNDRWIQQSGAPVEVDKQGAEVGTYQRPDLYGQPPEKGMDYDAQRRDPSPTAARNARRP